MKHQQHRQEIDNSPKLQQNIPVDIIKPAVVEAPTVGRVIELLKKRYRGEIFDDVVETALTKESLEKAVEYAVETHVRFDGHTRNIILTPAELAVQRRQSNREGVVNAIISEAKRTGDEGKMRIAYNRQVSMRKITNIPTWLFDHLVKKLVEEKILTRKTNHIETGKKIAGVVNAYAVGREESSYKKKLDSMFEGINNI